MDEVLKYTLDEIMTPTEAAEKWGLANGATIRKSIERGKFQDGEIKRSGNVWLLTPDAMYRVFGDPKDKTPVKSKGKLSAEPRGKSVEVHDADTSVPASENLFVEDMHATEATVPSAEKSKPIQPKLVITIDFNELQRKAYEYYMQSDKMEAYVNHVFVHAAEQINAGNTVSLLGFSEKTGGNRTFTSMDEYMEWVGTVGQYFSLSESTIDVLQTMIDA